ncbi:transposase, partial [bacterium]|nr:transposase [bacterium]
FEKIEAILDAAGFGPLHLREPAVAQVVMDGFAWLEEQKGWELMAAVVMPNHCHLLLGHPQAAPPLLDRDLGVLKGYTARQANRILGRRGHFWMDENFDHWCRSIDKVEATIQYIRENPVKAGLARHAEDWRWVV